jgi:TM2 domain-containing membrane protein YozV
MNNLLQLMPNLEPDEFGYIQGLLKDASDEKVQQFATIYNSRRKDPQTVLLLTLVGFLGVAGVQRFVLDQIGMGLLYLFTAGLCFIGTIVDLVNYKRLAFEYNQRVALQVSGMVAAYSR